MSIGGNNTQELLDQQAVRQTLTEIADYLRATEEERWKQTYQGATDFINEVYDEFTPHLTPNQRLTGVVAGAAVLAFHELKYGPDEYHPRIYGGQYEQNVIATYHHAKHVRGVMRGMFRYATAVNQRYPGTYDDVDFVQFPILGAAHDVIMGNGRGHDERQSGMFANNFLVYHGFLFVPDEEIQVATEATAWNAKRGRQAVNPVKGYMPMQRALPVGDLLSLFDERGVYEAVTLAPEDATKRLWDRVLTREAKAAGFLLVGKSVEELLEFFDTREALRRMYGRFLGSQVKLFTTFRPADPELDEMFTGRPANIELATELHDGYVNKGLSAVGTLHESYDFMIG